MTRILTDFDQWKMATFQKYHAIKLSFINKNLLKTCFDHNFSRSSPIRPSFCTLPELILLSTKQTLNPRKNALSEKKKLPRRTVAASLRKFEFLKRNEKRKKVWTSLKSCFGPPNVANAKKKKWTEYYSSSCWEWYFGWGPSCSYGRKRSPTSSPCFQ